MDTGLTQDQVLKNLQNAGYQNQPTGQKYVAPTGQVGGAYTNSGIISQNGTTPITPSSLAPVSPYNLPSAPATSSANGTGNQAVAFAKSQVTNVDSQLAQDEARLQGQEQNIMSLMDEQGQQETKRQQEYASAGLLNKKNEINTVTSAMEAKNLEARRQIDELLKNNPEGQSRAAIQATVNEIERKNASYQADQAIVLSALNRDFSTTQQFIDAKIDAETEGLKLRIDGLKYFYENNREDFNKDEERQYQALIKKQENELSEIKTEKDSKKNLALKYLEAGGDAYVAQKIVNAASFDEAVRLTGSTLGSKAIAENAKLLAEAANKVPITGEWASLINGATAFVAGTMKDGVRTNISNAISSGDYNTAIAEMENAVESGLIGDTKTKYSNARTDVALLKNLKTTIQEYADAGGDMGLLKGKEEEIKRKLGIDSGNASVMAVQLWREFQAYRNNITGAAFSEKESGDYASVNPTLGKSLDLNLSVIDGAINQLDNRVKSTVLPRLPASADLYKKRTDTYDFNKSSKDLVDAYVRENPTEAAKVANLYAAGKWSDDEVAEYLNLNK